MRSKEGVFDIFPNVVFVSNGGSGVVTTGSYGVVPTGSYGLVPTGSYRVLTLFIVPPYDDVWGLETLKAGQSTRTRTTNLS